MEQASTPFRKSWGLYFQVVAAMWAVGAALAYGGYYMVRSAETIVVILGGLFLFVGPVAILGAPFVPRPASGNCPVCGRRVYRMLEGGNQEFLLCPHCAGYLASSQDQLFRAPANAVSDEPAFAAALPWDDVAGLNLPTIALSREDVVMDRLSNLVTGDEKARVIDRWPPWCCVCGAAATRHADHRVSVLLKGRARETRAEIVARSVPYCAQHENGVAFGSVHFAVHMLRNPSVIGIKFRSHAFREAYRELNPARFETEP